jgi:hypothetical protein
MHHDAVTIYWSGYTNKLLKTTKINTALQYDYENKETCKNPTTIQL